VIRITADGKGMQTKSARWFGAGHSTATDSAKAGTEATAEAMDGRTPAVLSFDCGGRLARLGEAGARGELAAITSALGDLPFVGFCTMGEVGRARGALGMHHLTLVTLAMA
jgi:hypothetical protein